MFSVNKFKYGLWVLALLAFLPAAVAQRQMEKLGRGIVAVQDRVLFQLLLAIFGELDVRELQQLDRLLKLGRHDQGLALANFQSLTDCRHG